MCRHIYDWNIVNCDVKQPIHLTYESPKWNMIFFAILCEESLSILIIILQYYWDETIAQSWDMYKDDSVI